MTKATALMRARRRLGAAFLMFAILTGAMTPVEASLPDPPAPDVLTLREAAELLRVGADELEQLALRNEVPARRIGSSWRLNREALMAWLNGDWRLIAMIERPGLPGQQQPPIVTEAAEPADSAVLPPSELARLTGTGMIAHAATAPEGTPTGAAEAPIGEAPQEMTAEEVFLRGQKVLLARGEVAVDVGQFYARSDNAQLALVGDGIGLAVLNQSTFTTLFLGRVGILDETELFVGTTFRDQSSDAFIGGIRVAGTHRSELGDVRIGVRRTLLAEGPGRPNVIATLTGRVPTGDTSYAIGGGLTLVKSFDPVVLFASANYLHTFSRTFSDITRLEPENRFDVTLGYALALNDTLTISTAVSGVFSGETTFSGATLLEQENYSLQLGLTSFLATGLYIEPSVSFGLSGPGNSVAFGVTLPYTF